MATPIEQSQDLKQEWKISDGTLQLADNGGVVGFPMSSATTGTKVVVMTDEDGWNQEWKTVSHDPVLLNANGGLNQEWKANFIDPPYNYVLTPGFPGDIGSDQCLASTQDLDLAKAAMHFCDESMSLLVGSQTSLGNLRAIADLVNDDVNGGPNRMPGKCCFDTPTTNDAYFGINVSPNHGN